MSKKIDWIDFLKGLAILAVITDHLVFTYTNKTIQMHTQFSVTMFIFLSGITSCISQSRNTGKKGYISKRLLGIFIPYVVATVAYQLLITDYHFDFMIFKDYILNFNVSPPFYFIAFFMQLVLVSPILYKLFDINKSIYSRVISLIVIYILSLYLTHYTKISNIYGGGNLILGGTYLFVFALGMFFYFYMDKLKKSFNLFISIIGVLLLIAYEFLVDLKLGWSNPPNDHTIVFTSIIFMILYGVYNLFSKYIRYAKIELLGKYSLYIFLYHWLALKYFDKYIGYNQISDPYLRYFILLLWASVSPILLVVLYRKVKWFIFEKNMSDS